MSRSLFAPVGPDTVFRALPRCTVSVGVAGRAIFLLLLPRFPPRMLSWLGRWLFRVDASSEGGVRLFGFAFVPGGSSGPRYFGFLLFCVCFGSRSFL